MFLKQFITYTLQLNVTEAPLFVPPTANCALDGTKVCQSMLTSSLDWNTNKEGNL